MTATQSIAPLRQRALGAPAVLWPLLALGALLLFDLTFIRHFFHIGIANERLNGSLIDIFRWGAPVLFLSLGMTLVLATGGVDLSVGAIMALAGAVAARLCGDGGSGMAPMAAIGAALIVAMAAGAWNGFLVAVLEIQPIVATLVFMVAGRGAAKLLIGAANVPLSGTLWDRLGSVLGLPTAPILAIIAFAITAIMTRRTSIGLFIEATGANPVASRCAGVNVRRVRFLVYVFSSLCAGLAGIVAAADVHNANATHTGMYLELDAILAAVIGGTSLIGGRYALGGSFVGALLIQTLTTTLIYKVKVQQTLVVKAIVVLAVCLVQSGTFRRKLGGIMSRMIGPQEAPLELPQASAR